VEIEEARGHLLVAVARAGDLAAAAAHAAHPQMENLGPIIAALGVDSAALALSLGAALDQAGQTFASSTDLPRLEAAAAMANTALDEVASALFPATVRGDLAFQAQVMASLVEHAVAEYEEAVSSGAVREVTEYQDGYGFFHQARTLWRRFEGQVQAAAAHEYEEVEEQLDLLKTAFASVGAPASPVDGEQVEAWADKLVHELAEATGFPQDGPEAGSGTVAEDLKALTYYLAEALEALEAGDVAKAQHEYEEFDDDWERVEDGVRAKSRDAYRDIELAMSDVKSLLLRQDAPDAARAADALKTLAETIDASLPGLR
jgi:hypothetical protein